MQLHLSLSCIFSFTVMLQAIHHIPRSSSETDNGTCCDNMLDLRLKIVGVRRVSPLFALVEITGRQMWWPRDGPLMTPAFHSETLRQATSRQLWQSWNALLDEYNIWNSKLFISCRSFSIYDVSESSRTLQVFLEIYSLSFFVVPISSKMAPMVCFTIRSGFSKHLAS